MKQIALAYFPMTWLTGIGLLCFASVFIAACIWIYRPYSKSIYATISDLPLQDPEKAQDND